jgi:flagellar assembly protein FliH
MDKLRNASIKSFQFKDLESNHVVSGNEFKPFEFTSLQGESLSAIKASEEEMRSERRHAQNNSFKIDELVRDYRGLTRQEKSDIEHQIHREVERRVEAAFQEAFDDGLVRGRAEGKEIALVEFHDELAKKIEDFTQVIVQVQTQSEGILEKSRAEVYEFIKRFTKWIILKEVNEKVYLEGLLEKLILELNVRKNLIIKVGRGNFTYMPQVVKAVEERVGSLSNVRIEVVPEINYPGIILESENGLIDGSMESVFLNIDKIFEQVLKHE